MAVAFWGRQQRITWLKFHDLLVPDVQRNSTRVFSHPRARYQIDLALLFLSALVFTLREHADSFSNIQPWCWDQTCRLVCTVTCNEGNQPGQFHQHYQSLRSLGNVYYTTVAWLDLCQGNAGLLWYQHVSFVLTPAQKNIFDFVSLVCRKILVFCNTFVSSQTLCTDSCSQIAIASETCLCSGYKLQLLNHWLYLLHKFASKDDPRRFKIMTCPPNYVVLNTKVCMQWSEWVGMMWSPHTDEYL